MADAPATIPIFPLAGVLLLPGGHLPLNIFEPRYLQMVRDAMAGERVIGMVQPTDPTTRAFEPPVYPVGCTGRISRFKETPDNRFLITLTGQRRFTIAEELTRTTLYRQVRVSYEAFPDDRPATHDEEQAVDRARLLGGLKRYLERAGMKADWSAIEEAPTGALVTTLAMVCPFEPSEKQALLEAKTLAQRAKLMTALIEMGLSHGSQGGGGGEDKAPRPRVH
jgi:Lon protease-like protein